MTTNIGLIFDFDDTIAPDSTTQLLEEKGVDPQEFWAVEFPELVRVGYDPTIAYLRLILDKIGPDDQLGELTREDLEAFGKELSESFYSGVPELFDDILAITEDYNDVEMHFYIISEGLESIIKGMDIHDRFDAIYASRLASGKSAVLDRIQRPISFTDKTRYIYEINKGIPPSVARRNPWEVNKEMDPEDQKIPFENMIYVGDGITDIPCFSLVKDRGGRVFGVVDREGGSAKQEAIRELGSPRRAGNLNDPNYGPDGRLGSLLRLTIEGLCTDRTIDELEAI